MNNKSKYKTKQKKKEREIENVYDIRTEYYNYMNGMTKLIFESTN